MDQQDQDKDTKMEDAAPLEPTRSSESTETTNSVSPAPINHESPIIKNEELLSIGNSNRNTPVPQSLQFQVPSDVKPAEIIGGAPVRQWLNEHVTPFLLEGVRKISKERPEDPLRALGEYLIQQSEAASKAQ